MKHPMAMANAVKLNGFSIDHISLKIAQMKKVNDYLEWKGKKSNKKKSKGKKSNRKIKKTAINR